MTALTLKVPEQLERKIKAAAERQHTSRSDVMRRAVEKYIDQDLPDEAGPSVYDLAKDFAGSVEGPHDLSSHRRHMKGYGT